MERLDERYRGPSVNVIRQAVVIEAPPEEVWKVVSDPRNLPRWNAHIRSVTGAPDRELRPGDSYWTELGAMGIHVRVRSTVESVDRPRSAVVRISGPIRGVVRTWLRPVGSGRCRLEHEVEYSMAGGPVGAMISAAVKRLGGPTILRRGLTAQKRQVEAG